MTYRVEVPDPNDSWASWNAMVFAGRAEAIEYARDLQRGAWCVQWRVVDDNGEIARSDSMTYRVEVQADSVDSWASNALTFATVDDAAEYARDLQSRWLLVRAWRVVDANGDVHDEMSS